MLRAHVADANRRPSFSSGGAATGKGMRACVCELMTFCFLCGESALCNLLSLSLSSRKSLCLSVFSLFFVVPKRATCVLLSFAVFWRRPRGEKTRDDWKNQKNFSHHHSQTPKMKPYTICKFRVSPPLFFFSRLGCVMFSQKSTIFGTITLVLTEKYSKKNRSPSYHDSHEK